MVAGGGLVAQKSEDKSKELEGVFGKWDELRRITNNNEKY